MACLSLTPLKDWIHPGRWLTLTTEHLLLGWDWDPPPFLKSNDTWFQPNSTGWEVTPCAQIAAFRHADCGWLMDGSAGERRGLLWLRRPAQTPHDGHICHHLIVPTFLHIYYVRSLQLVSRGLQPHTLTRGQVAFRCRVSGQKFTTMRTPSSPARLAVLSEKPNRWALIADLLWGHC